MNDELEYEYDEHFVGTCDVLPSSAVDIWAGTDILGSECGATATWVVQEFGEEANYVCEIHAKAWEQNDEENLVFVSKLSLEPVTEDEVQAAIESIKAVVKP